MDAENKDFNLDFLKGRDDASKYWVNVIIEYLCTDKSIFEIINPPKNEWHTEWERISRLLFDKLENLPDQDLNYFGIGQKRNNILKKRNDLNTVRCVDILCKQAHEVAFDNGFYEGLDYKNDYHISTKLMLIVSEIAEATEALRAGNKLNFRKELADVAIRLLDLCGWQGIDLGFEINQKMLYNKDRDQKHGKRF